MGGINAPATISHVAALVTADPNDRRDPARVVVTPRIEFRRGEEQYPDSIPSGCCCLRSLKAISHMRGLWHDARMTPRGLRQRILSLSANAPLTERFDGALAARGQCHQNAWWSNHQEHWLCWLKQKQDEQPNRSAKPISQVGLQSYSLSPDVDLAARSGRHSRTGRRGCDYGGTGDRESGVPIR